MSKATETKPVYHHNCPMFGPNTKVMRALMADKNGEYVLCYQFKCLCGHTVGEPEYAKGVTPDPDGGYLVDTNIAEKMR